VFKETSPGDVSVCRQDALLRSRPTCIGRAPVDVEGWLPGVARVVATEAGTPSVSHATVAFDRHADRLEQIGAGTVAIDLDRCGLGGTELQYPLAEIDLDLVGDVAAPDNVAGNTDELGHVAPVGVMAFWPVE